MSAPALDPLAVLYMIKESYGGDAIFRPSSIDRSIKCKGSAVLIGRAGRRRAPSKYAIEGSVAHKVAEEALSGTRQPHEYVGQMVHIDREMRYGWQVDEEMENFVGDYLDEIRSRITDGVELLVEQRMSLSALDPSEPIFAENRGTGDAVLLNRARRRITIGDLKYGKGVMVSPHTPQLKNYGLLAILNYPVQPAWQEVELLIVQPRAIKEEERVKSVIFNVHELMADFMPILLQTMDEALVLDAPLTPGSHCHWCPAREAGICPALQIAATGIGKDALETMPAITTMTVMPPIPQNVHVGTVAEPAPPPPVPATTVVLPPVHHLSPSDVATVLDRRQLWNSWITAIEQKAVRFIEEGINVPGYQLSSRAGHRRWKLPPAETEAKLRELGVRTIDMYSAPKMLTPPQMEKKIDKKFRGLLDPSASDPLVERPMGEPTLIKATELRPALETGMGPIPGFVAPLPATS